ncbi:retrotransposon gag protein [Tanacetum coccineum]
MCAMDYLIDTPEDVAKLVRSQVLVNAIGSNEEAADIINDICKQVPFKDFYYEDEWKQMDEYYNAYWPNLIVELRRKYFKNPWSFIALLAGIVLFILTVVQTVYGVKYYLWHRDAEDALSKLLQIGTVAEYHDEFEMLINRVTGISKFLLASFYISGLKLTIQIELLRAKPTSLGEAFFLARIIEARFEAIAEKEKMHINKKKEDIILSLQRKLASPEVKGSLDADEDIGVDEQVWRIFKNKESMEEVVVSGGEALGVDEDESNRVISVLKDGGGDLMIVWMK